VTADLIDIAPNSAWVIEGLIGMAIDGFIYFGVECTMYSGANVIGQFQRGSPLLVGPFEGRFRFGVVRSALGDLTGYSCFANVYGTRNGMNWRAYEEPNADIAGGYGPVHSHGRRQFLERRADHRASVVELSRSTKKRIHTWCSQRSWTAPRFACARSELGNLASPSRATARSARYSRWLVGAVASARRAATLRRSTAGLWRNAMERGTKCWRAAWRATTACPACPFAGSAAVRQFLCWRRSSI